MSVRILLGAPNRVVIALHSILQPFPSESTNHNYYPFFHFNLLATVSFDNTGHVHLNDFMGDNLKDELELIKSKAYADKFGWLVQVHERMIPNLTHHDLTAVYF